ncbi:MAG: cobalamin-binding protein [Zoogloeaceae bacterium]|nr:cobalamin-binding protein [Zoogloeaceae bacterium]
MIRRLLTPLLVALLPALVQADAITVIDDLGREVRLTEPARRIVSLAPHVTELLYASGAGDYVVGAVSYSDYPEAARALPRVGGYHKVDVEAVIALRPDLVVGWGEGNRPAERERLQALGIPVFVNDPHSLDDIARSLRRIGRLAGTSATADAAAEAFRERLAALEAVHARRTPVRVFYQVWHSPLMTVNGEHLISEVIRLCGGDNVFATLATLTPRIGTESVLATNPQAIVASGMDASRPEWLDDWRRWGGLTAVRNGHLFHIPPDLIQRHSPRILDGAERLCGQLEEVRKKL